MQSDDEVQCFRSAVLTRSPRTKFSINPEMLRVLRLFRSNSIVKLPRQVRSAGANPTCEVNIMFVNRKKPEGWHPNVPGFISNIWRLRREIKRRASKFRDLGLRVRINAVTLDNKRLRYQIDAMQKSDIVVAGSSPYLANMIFLRENSTVIEVMPFGFYPKAFEIWLAIRLMCDTTLILRIQMSARSEVACIALRHEELPTFQRRQLDFVRPCATFQRLNSNATMFATTIIHHARLQCGIGTKAPTL
eukprot:IDg6597t1